MAHPRSINGVFAPSKEELYRLELSEVTTALTNTVGAFNNTTTKGYTKDDLNKMIEEAIAKCTTEKREEMKSMKEEMVQEAQAIWSTIDLIESPSTSTKLALEGNMDTSN